MYTANDYIKNTFGEKLYKISLNGGMTCPNRDGTCGTRGCIFCSEGGSGDFAASAALDIDKQIESAKIRVSKKYSGSRFIAYFQAFTNTYADTEYLRKLFFRVISREDIAALSIATRPDCLEDDKLLLLAELNQIKPVWVELGLQTVSSRTAEYIRRGYELPVYDDAIQKLNSIGIHTITHVILGLPGETAQDMINTVKHTVAMQSAGIKLQLLHVLKNTDLAVDYEKGLFSTMTLEEYIDILKKCLRVIPDKMVIHRITGDGPKNILISPLWSADKKRVLNEINRALKE